MSAPVTLTGRLTADPELRFTAKGDAVLNLRVVTSGRKKTDDGWVDVDTTFWTVSAWRQMAENVANSIQKGDAVVVVGKVKSRQYDDKEGNKRTAWEVAADHIAADLKWTTVNMQRVERSTVAAKQQDDPWASQEPTPF
jgi:single-strand DNA-binding protein